MLPWCGVCVRINQLKHKYNASDPDNVADRRTNREAFKALIADADIIIDETYYSTFSDATSSAVLFALNLTSSDTSYNFIKNQKIFRQDKTVSASGRWMTHASAL